MISGPTELDPCSFRYSSGFEEGEKFEKISFDSGSGDYEFSSQNMEEFPIGKYIFKITGSIAKYYSDYIVFEMILVEPCSAAKIEIISDNVFHDMVYTLGDPPEF